MGKIRKGLFFLTAAFWGLAVTAQAEKAADYVLEADTVYELDLQGDGTPEEFSFETYVADEEKSEEKGVMDFYVNGVLAGSITDEDRSYYWKVSQCPLADGNTCLLAASVSDSDWTPHILFLNVAEEGIEVVSDLVSLTRQTEEESDRLLSQWARGYAVSETDGNSFNVKWLEAFRATGNVYVSVTYTLKEGEIVQAEEKGMLEEQQNWTAWQTFDVLCSAEEGAAAAYQVVPGDVVHLSEYIKVNDKAYFKCTNQNGEEGWLPDAESYDSQMTEDGQNILCGYFEEAIYAG